MWLAVSEAVVQGFAGLVLVLVVAGVLAVLGLGSRVGRSGARRPRAPERRPARLPEGTSVFPLRVGPAHRNGTSRERLRR